MIELDTIICGNCLDVMKDIQDNSVDLIVTDPPYALNFMQKKWDSALSSVDIWSECLRVLKAGAFAFIMSSPRQDVLSRMIVNLEDAGFVVGFTSIYWCYASGFPKASNISKMVDKRFRRDYVLMAVELGFMPKSKSSIYDWTVGEHSPSEKYWEEFKSYLTEEQWQQVESKVIATTNQTFGYQGNGHGKRWDKGHKITIPSTPEAKALDGSYGGFQPKPALEVVLVVMKPLSEKTFVDQALANGHGVTWLDDGRIPTSEIKIADSVQSDKGIWHNAKGGVPRINGNGTDNPQGRFPANILCGSGIDVNLNALLEAKRILNEKS